ETVDGGRRRRRRCRLLPIRLTEDADGARRRLARVSAIALVAVRRAAPHRARLIANDRRGGPARAPRAGPFDFFALLATRFVFELRGALELVAPRRRDRGGFAASCALEAAGTGLPSPAARVGLRFVLIFGFIFILGLALRPAPAVGYAHF